jgi:hypothetical protein
MIKFLPENFNDLLALCLIFGIALMWSVDAAVARFTLPSEVNGGLLVTWTLIVQYYFRKKQEEK